MNKLLVSFFLLSCMVGSTLYAQTSVHDFTMKTIDGEDVPLSRYKGKVLLVVNVASQCGYTPQYAGLETLFEKYKDKGFMILGFPANNFGAQEPGTDAEIKTFCTSTFNVTFDMFSKISVKGDDKHPLYQFLTNGGGNNAWAGEIGWNFDKFLVGKDGKVIKRYKHRVSPDNEELIEEIEEALK